MLRFFLSHTYFCNDSGRDSCFTLIHHSFRILSLLISWHVTSTFLQVVLLSRVSSLFSSFSVYLCHSSFTWSLSITTFPFEYLTQFTATTSCQDLAICFLILWTLFFPSILFNSLTSLFHNLCQWNALLYMHFVLSAHVCRTWWKWFSHFFLKNNMHAFHTQAAQKSIKLQFQE